jgi:signal transduction histidine kinase
MNKILSFILLITLLHCKKDNKYNTSNSSNPSNANFARAKEFTNTNLDSAFIHFNLAKNDFLIKNDSVGAARSLVNMAIIQSDKGDYYGSIETSLEADKYLKTAPKNKLVNNLYSSNYNNLAISSKFLENFSDAEKYYQEALKMTIDENYISVINNNISDMLILQNKTEPAINHLQKLLNSKDSISYARILNNLAKAKFLGLVNYNAIPELEKALRIRELQKDTLGMNSSFATLADYFYSKDKKKSLFYAKMMLNRASLNKSPDDQLEALQKIINLDKENYLKYFGRFQTLNDSVQTARSKAKNQFAVIRYDVEQKNADNQKLKRQDAEKEVKIFRQYLIVAILIVAIVFIIIWYRRRQIRLRQEKELEVKNTQLKMSKKVHDVVANGLYHMMIDVQNNPEMDKTRILNDIEKMYEESRDISHENIAEEDFALRFINMLTSYSSDEQKVFPVGYQESIWENISYNTQLELYYILREILVNMKKHSQAKLASVKFEKQENILKIKYTDNGTGINDLDKQKGTGIQNTENRMDTIGGDITFEKNPAGGLIIQLTIPIQSKHV